MISDKKVMIAKALMNIFPANIEYLERSFSENVNHDDFIEYAQYHVDIDLNRANIVKL